MKRAFHQDRRSITIHFILAWLFFYGALHLGYLSYETHKQIQRQQIVLDAALQRIGFYDKALTMAAKSGSYDLAEDWEQQYEAWLMQLESSLHDIVKACPACTHAVGSLEMSNMRLVAFERMAFAISKQGRPRAATALLDSVSYNTEKKDFLKAATLLDDKIRHERQQLQHALRVRLASFGAGILLFLGLMWLMLYRAYSHLDRRLAQEQTKHKLAERLLAPESAPLDEDITWALQLLGRSTGAEMALLIRWRPDCDAHRWPWHEPELAQSEDCIKRFGDLLESRPLPADTVLDGEKLRRHFTALHAPCNILENASSILCVSSPIESGRHSALVFMRMQGRMRWSEDDITGIKGIAETLSRSIDKRDQEAQMYRLATTDSLTGIANHRHFIELLGLEMKRALRSKAPCALLMMDIDHFKAVNDTYGHEAGDAVLVQLTAAVRGALRGIDAFGRLGGEEFAAVLPGADAATAMQVAERLRAGIEANPVVTRAGTIRVTISLGITLVNHANDDVDAILRRADNAMYQAKNDGRNCIRTVLP